MDKLRTRIEQIGYQFFVDVWINGGRKNDTVWPTNDGAIRRVEVIAGSFAPPITYVANIYTHFLY